jgi:NitT/TauT family transport system substrate-binding protein
MAVAALPLLALPLLARPIPVGAAQAVTLTLPSVTPAEAAYFAAQQKGYFSAEGLEAELIFSGGGTATPALLSGSVDGSASGAAALSAILRGAALRIVLVFTDSPAYQVWAQSGIHTLADLKGKSVGVTTRGDTFEIAMRLALQAADISPDAVGYTPVGFGNGAGAAFDSGALAALVVSPGTVFEMQQQGQFKTAHMLTDFFGKVHMPWNAFAMTERTLYGNPVLAKKMLRAIVKGAQYMKAFRTEAIALSDKYEKNPNVRANELEYDEFIKELTPDWTVGDALITSDLSVRAELLNIPKDAIPPIAKIYDFAVVRAVNAELDASHWRPTR